MLLIVVDAHSKWVEVGLTASATSKVTMEYLRELFARFGLPQTVVTDNGSCFTSTEFMKKNGIEHITTSPYHPSSNGMAERTVQLVKKGLGSRIFERQVSKVFICI